ncbi:carotenoid biosynthesis protein [Paucihalobacter ruber]|uniref:Carotenoid biosynthesis protein n=1 Tax=Paucihalobacter ruber TaxID=2567861 RepID=A0A506PL36_9FLAO|nr:carotenoid biosynthesis protein [Paucihalobacter ruber]TPV33912.1 carotenoid biosynthesis protein [Paucihalobacter ruber]
MTWQPKYKLWLSIFLIWLFTISGIIGISSPNAEWFLSLTPLNLLLTFTIMFVNIQEINLKVFAALSIPFFLGFVTEALGVNFGLVYGNYTYGNNLGFKVFGVPLLICINWAVLTAITADIAKQFFKNIWVSAFTGAALMTGLDVIIEVSAPRFDYWEFENGIVPLQNYLGWLGTAFLAHLAYQKFNIKTNRTLSRHIYISILVFFSAFLIF